MSFWNYIGEFFLFRRLFGRRGHDDASMSETSFGTGSDDTADDLYSQSYNDFLDEQEDYDMMDEDF